MTTHSRKLRCVKERLRELVQAYYGCRGWNEQGVPKDETVSRLGLHEHV